MLCKPDRTWAPDEPAITDDDCLLPSRLNCVCFENFCDRSDHWREKNIRVSPLKLPSCGRREYIGIFLYCNRVARFFLIYPLRNRKLDYDSVGIIKRRSERSGF